jgi:hypothetical protein
VVNIRLDFGEAAVRWVLCLELAAAREREEVSRIQGR